MTFGWLVLTALPGIAHATPGSAGTGGLSGLEEIAGVLRQRTEDTRSEEQVVGQLARIGPKAIPGLFEVYTGVAIDRLLQDEEAVWWCSYDRFGDVALRALGELPPKNVLGHLARVAGPSAELELRLAGVRVAGALRSSRGLVYVLGTADDLGAKQLRYRSVRGSCVDALAAILAAEERSFADLAALEDVMDEELVRLSIEAVTLADQPAGVDYLLSLMGTDTALDLVLVDAAAGLARRHAWRDVSDPSGEIGQLLGAEEARLRQAAAVALGRLQAVDSFSQLVALLDDPDAGVRRSAQWSLELLSGRARLENGEEWTAWHDQETEWWDTQGARLLYELTTGESKRIRAAAKELARHELYRDELAAELGSLLPTVGPAVAGELCALLAELDSPMAVPYLVEFLFEAQGAVRKVTWKALRTLTGEDLPPDAWTWKEFLRA